jgi:hypothetical protein
MLVVNAYFQHVSRAELRKFGEAKSAGLQVTKSQAQLEYNALYDLSMKRLKEWVEEDEDKVAESERETRMSKIAEAKIAHDQFVKQKDRYTAPIF